jgi:hypothetical protein
MVTAAMTATAMKVKIAYSIEVVADRSTANRRNFSLIRVT